MIKTSPRPSDRRVQTVCLLILTLIAVATALAELQPVLVPFVLAIFFSQCLSPLIDLLMQRYRWPQVVAVSVAALLAVAVVTGVGFLLASSVSGMSEQKNIDEYKAYFQNHMEDVMKSRPVMWLGIKQGETADKALALVKDKGVDLFEFVATAMANALKNTASVLIFMAFILFGRRRRKFGPGLCQNCGYDITASPDRCPECGLAPTIRREGILGEIEISVQRYISLTVFISILTGILVGASLSILGVQFAAGFGFLAFLLNFIPNLGAVVATVLPLPLVFLDPHLSLVAEFLALAIPSLVQVGIGFIQPRMMGQSLDLHPVVVLLSLLFFTMIWGLGGAFLATPLTAVIKIVFEKIPATRSLGAILAGNLDPLAKSFDSQEAVEAGVRTD